MLDRSASMNAHDIAPSRFSRATLEIRNFVRQKPDGIDRIGLVGFADAAVVLSYLTRDLDSVLFYFDWIDKDPTPLFGTNIGAALKSAMDVASKDDRPTRKIFLLVSDGEDYGAELKRALADGAHRRLPRELHRHRLRRRRCRFRCATADGKETLLRDDAGRRSRRASRRRRCARSPPTTGGRYVRSPTGDELQRRRSREIVGGERRTRRLAHRPPNTATSTRRCSRWPPSPRPALWLLL